MKTKLRTYGHSCRIASLAAMSAMLALAAASCMDIMLPANSGINDLHESSAQYCSLSISGRISDIEGHPVEDITVTITGRYIDNAYYKYGRNHFPLGTVVSDKSGSYAFRDSAVTPPFPNIQINISDRNGVYAPDSLIVRSISYSGGDGENYAGNATVSVPDITLKKNRP